MSENKITVGEAIARFIEQINVKTVFGVISIHNMPILDAIGRRNNIRYVMSRGEAGGLNMADAYARVSHGLGVAFTSTGTAAGNAAGALVEALTAGSPVLHITGQIETEYIDQDLAYIHEANLQLGMLQSISKAAFRIRTKDTALATIKEAVRIALTAPRGPVSVEIPIDIQAALIEMPEDFAPLPIPTLALDLVRVTALAEHLRRAKRPMLWLGGGARASGSAVKRLLALGFGVVSSVQGRGIVAEDHPQNLGAFNLQPNVEAFYQTCDAMLAVGTRLRGNETLKYKLKLPKPLYRIDAYGLSDQRGYKNDMFILGDADASLALLADLLEDKSLGQMQIDPLFKADLARAHAQEIAICKDGLGEYASLVQILQDQLGQSFNWVRDVTISNSTWGNRLLKIFDPLAGVHAVGGGIGQGIQMAIGASLAPNSINKKTVCLVGDGGLQVNIGELMTLVQEQANVIIILMNDQCYGVIRNIQDAQYGGRRYFVDIAQPNFTSYCQSLGLAHAKVQKIADFKGLLEKAYQHQGPYMLEIDMVSIGAFKTAFAGPPVKA